MSKSSLTMQDLLDAGVHFGHTRSHWHPAMKPFVYLTRERIHIMDLSKTLEKLGDLTNAVENFVAEGNSLVLVGTKRQAKQIVTDTATELGLPYVSERWLGGTLTNFDTMRQAIARMNRLEELIADEAVTGAAKRQRRRYEQELERMRLKFGGLKNLKVVPQGLFIIDPSFEANAVKEARRLGLTIFAILDTSSNPALVDEFVPANDDAAKSIQIIMTEVAAAIKRGQGRSADKVKEAAAEAERPVETKIELTKAAAPVEVKEEPKTEVKAEPKKAPAKKPAAKKAPAKKVTKK